MLENQLSTALPYVLGKKSPMNSGAAGARSSLRGGEGGRDGLRPREGPQAVLRRIALTAQMVLM